MAAVGGAAARGPSLSSEQTAHHNRKAVLTRVSTYRAQGAQILAPGVARRTGHPSTGPGGGRGTATSKNNYSPSSTSPGSTTVCTCSDSAYAHFAYTGSIVQKATRMYLVMDKAIRLRGSGQGKSG